MARAPGQRTGSRPSWTSWLLWALLLALWSTALLTPHPVEAGRAVLPAFPLFLAAKALHVGAYAVLACLGGRLPGSRRGHILVPIALAAHAITTELLQTLVRLRTGGWRDVGLDFLGILLGAALGRRRLGLSRPEGKPFPSASSASDVDLR